MKYIFLLNAFILLSQFTLLAGNDYVIVGKTGFQQNGKQFMLLKFNEETVCDVDTAVVIDGRFEFKGRIDKPAFAIISCGNYPEKVLSTRLMIEPGIIRVNFDTATVSIGGTPLNDGYQIYLEKKAILKDSAELIVKQNKSKESTTEILHASLINLMNRAQLLNKEFIIRNSANEMGVALFKEMLTGISVEDYFEICQKSDSRLKSEPGVKKFLPYFEKELRKKQERIATQDRIKGKLYYDFAAFGSDGKKIRLSEKIKKDHYTLLVFWASWCGPCMAEQSTIKRVYEMYHDKGVDVIGVSLDSNETAWKQAIAKIESNWTQIRPLDAVSKTLYDAYGFSGIPCNVILSKDGRVMFSNVPKQAIQPCIEALLKEK
jgi:thiol-disulfide isomerase/thioredoxin